MSLRYITSVLQVFSFHSSFISLLITIPPYVTVFARYIAHLYLCTEMEENEKENEKKRTVFTDESFLLLLLQNILLLTCR